MPRFDPRIPTLRPPSAARHCLVWMAAIALVGCSKGNGPSNGNHAGANGPKEKPIAVAVQAAALGTVVQKYSTTASLEAENKAQILARTSGVVERLLTEEGQFVESNQELLRLEDTEAQLQLRQAQVALEEARSVFERQKASIEKEVITHADFDLAKANLAAAEVAVDLAQHTLSYTRVRAPFKGTITQRLIDVGQTVNIGTPLFEIANFQPLLARVHVPAKEFGSLKAGQEVDLVLDSSGESLTGTIERISPVIDASTGTIKITVRLDQYPEGTRPGDFTQVRIVTERHDEALRVPNIAVFEDKGEQIVFVAADSVAQRRPVRSGFVDDTYTEILEGLQEGEHVVVKGQRSLKEGAAIRVLETEHASRREDDDKDGDDRASERSR